MKMRLLLLLALVSSQLFLAAQKKEDKKTVGEKVEEFTEALLAQPDKGIDSDANKLVSGNVAMEIHTLWKEKGTLFFNDYKLDKTHNPPLDETMPLAEKKIIQAVTIALNTNKKTAAEKKDGLLKEIKTHLTGYYKEAGVAVSGADITAKVNAAVSSPESFTTAQGRTGELYFANDIQTTQSDFVALLILAPDAKGNLTYAQIRYTRFTYETTLPEDANELKTFLYADEEKVYADFTKKMLKTVTVR